jgi:hypothetical protein
MPLTGFLIVGTATAFGDVPLVIVVAEKEQIRADSPDLQVADVEQLDVASYIVEHTVAGRRDGGDAGAPRSGQ